MGVIQLKTKTTTMKKIRNYAWRIEPLCRYFTLLFLLLPIILSSSPVSSVQHVFPDRIHFGDEPGKQKIIFPAQSVSQQLDTGMAEWTGLNNQVASDNQYVLTTLNPGQQSATLAFNAFNAEIPDGAIIQAFKILAEGYSSTENAPHELTIALADEQGTLISGNYANIVSKGQAWPEPQEEDSWKYGIINEAWLTTIDAAFINDGNWHIVISVENETNQVLDIGIDQLSVEIFYTPLYTLCKEDCGITFVEEEGPGYDYNWILPEGMEISSQLENHHIINFMMTDRNYGIKEICVEITVPTGEQKTLCRNMRFINCTPSVIGDFVWLDEDRDGIQDLEEPGIPGIEMILKTGEGDEVARQTTDGNGFYSFIDVSPGEYFIEANYSGILLPTLFNAGDDTYKDNFFNLHDESIRTPVFTLDFDQVFEEADLGLMPGGLIGDYVWLDYNSNGKQDPEEKGINDLTIDLFNAEGTLVETTITATHPVSGFDGFYSFNPNTSGNYYLVLSIPDDFLPAEPGIGNEEEDSDITGANGTGSTDIFELDINSPINNIDLGLVYKPASVGDYIWKDWNENGIQDDGLTGIDDVTLKLYDSNDQLVRETTSYTQSDTSGRYWIGALNPGLYYIEVLLNEQQISTLFQSGDLANDSDFTLIEEKYRTELFELAPGENRTDIDFGIIDKRAVLEGLVWYDTDEDGLYGPEETGLPNVDVLLFEVDGSLYSEMVSDENGDFVFPGIRPGDYYLQFVFEDSYEPTIFQAGLDPDMDSDINSLIAYGTTHIFSCLPGDTLRNIFGGLIDRPLVIGDRVWLDENKNGLQDPQEEGLNGIEIRIYESNGQYLGFTQSTNNPITGDAGYYALKNFPEGNYYLRFIAPTGYLFAPGDAGTDEALDSDVLEFFGEGTTDSFYFPGNQDFLDLDAGLFLDTSSGVGDFVWEDLNGNGLQDENEAGLNGIDIDLFDASGTFIRSTTSGEHPQTGEPGYYLFDALAAGNYYLAVDIPVGLYSTDPTAGSDDTLDSDIDESNGPATSYTFTLTLEDTLTTIDIGLYALGVIGDFVWDDGNSNGVQDSEEAGVNDVLVELYTSEDLLVASTTTSFNTDNGEPGYYEFSNVVPGEYYLNFYIGESAEFSLFNATSDDLDSDVTGAFGKGTTSLLRVLSDETNRTIDAGISLEGGDINGVIWLDINANGIYDETTEEGLNGFLVRLIREDGSHASQVFSYYKADIDQDGFYEFRNIPAGNYFIKIEKPDNYLNTLANQGTEDTLDSEIDGSNGPETSALFAIVNDELIERYNAGVYIPSSIGDYVWYDDDQDGIQDEEEPGAADVEVILLKNGNFPADTTFTNALGQYSFTGLTQGVYAILFKAPADFGFTERNSGSDDAIDSDAGMNGKSSLISLAHGAQFRDLDAGLVPLSNLVGNLVWYDLDGDGNKSDDEIGISGAEIYLHDKKDALIENTISGFHGEYSFYNMAPGEYYIRVIRPSLAEPLEMQGETFEDATFLREKETNIFLIETDSYLENQNVGFTISAQENDYPEISDDFVLFPNPFQSTIQIELNSLEIMPNKVVVSNMIGTRVKEQWIGPFDRRVYLDLSALTSDTYWVNMMKGDEVVARKIIYKSEQ